MGNQAYRSIKNRLRREEGQTLIEYSMMIALFSVALIASLGFLHGAANTMYDHIVDVVVHLV